MLERLHGVHEQLSASALIARFVDQHIRHIYSFEIKAELTGGFLSSHNVPSLNGSPEIPAFHASSLRHERRLRT